MNSNSNFCDNTLLKNLDKFRIAESDATFRFYHKLADENNWSRTFSRRVIREYKKFLYLATVHGPVTPSKVVDVAWHLHLTYTHSYWNRLCKKVLRYKLHHIPSQGGSSEDKKHRHQYRKTLALYQKIFGAKPPQDIWPEISTQKKTIGVGKVANWTFILSLLLFLPACNSREVIFFGAIVLIWIAVFFAFVLSNRQSKAKTKNGKNSFSCSTDSSCSDCSGGSSCSGGCGGGCGGG